jgi:hypothetical protein
MESATHQVNGIGEENRKEKNAPVTLNAERGAWQLPVPFTR